MKNREQISESLLTGVKVRAGAWGKREQACRNQLGRAEGARAMSRGEQ